MPEIARFYGIVIRMYFREHEPPHFHVQYAEHHAVLALDGTLLQGDVPERALSLVREWAALHHAELAECWQRARRYEAPGRVAPLD